MNLCQIAAEFAVSLSKIEAGWEFFPQPENPENYSWQRIKHSDGRVIWFSCKKEKWHFSGRTEDGVYCSLPNPEISMSISKTPDKIAADIYRRLIPGYNAYFAECTRISKEHKAYAERKQSLAEKVTELLGCQPRRDNSFYVNGFNFEVCDGSIKVDGNIPEALVPEFFRMLKLTA
jgi:hypothetical protein